MPNISGRAMLPDSTVPEYLKPQCPSMPEICIDLPGVIKLLANPKPDKAAGPDSIKPIVLKE